MRSLSILTMSLLPFWALNVSVALLSMEGVRKLSNFIKNILISIPKMNKVLWVWNDMRVNHVINDNIFSHIEYNVDEK